MALAVMIGGTVALTRTSNDAPLDAAVPASSPSLVVVTPSISPSTSPAAVKPSPKVTRPAEPASRSGTRTTKPVSGTGKVTQSGTCEASFYWEPQPTANGETFDPEAMTAAHKSLPFNSRVRVTNLSNKKSVVVRINDRGPYIDGRCIDLSRGAFRLIEDLDAGVADVKYEVLG